jgi:GntR family transcriptional regulator
LNSLPVPIRLDFRSGVPIYIQISDQVRQMMSTGSLKKGDQLPTVRQLATDIRVNYNTVARAYRLLDEAGLISTQQGRGTYIWETPTEETGKRMRQEVLESLANQYVAQARRLQYSNDEITDATGKALAEKLQDEFPE